MKDLIIVGAGGFGREVVWLVERINQSQPTWKVLGFVDDALIINLVMQLCIDKELERYRAWREQQA